MSKPARALRSLRRPPHQWGLVCWHVAWCVVSKPGQAPPLPTGTAVPSGALHSRMLSFTGAADESRETVIAFAGVCSVSGETDDTIASQIHLLLVLFHRANASWVSWRRPEAPALVPTVTSRGAVSSMGATKFAQRRLSMTIARKHSPSASKMAQNECFIACWASIFTEIAHTTSRWANFVAPSGTVIRLRTPPPSLRPGRPVCRCPPCRRNRLRTRIGYCDMDRL